VTITNADKISARMQGTVLESGWVFPIDADTIQVEVPTKSSLAALYSANVYGLGQAFNITFINNSLRVTNGATIRTQIFNVSLPTS